MKAFFIHYQNPNSHVSFGEYNATRRHTPRGFTAYIQDNPSNPHTVLVSVSLCAPADAFCKKMGRQVALNDDKIAFNKRDIPKLLAELKLLTYTKKERRAMLQEHGNSDDNLLAQQQKDYFYTYRYML